jgi:hypothetical protein
LPGNTSTALGRTNLRLTTQAFPLTMFHLYCDSLNSTFTLCQESERWQLTFDSFEDAYDQAEACATDEIQLVLHNAHGAVVYQTTISPLEPALLKARSHWKDVAAGVKDGNEPVLAAAGR